MASNASSLSKYAVNAKDTEGPGPGASGPLKPTRGKKERVGIAVRLNREDWHRATELAMREQTSLQRLLVAGLTELLRQRGLPPLAGG